MISIIGAGPIGCHTAYLLARNGRDVNVLEEHPLIGLPVQCTGIVTSSIKDVINLPKESIANTVTKARIYAPNKGFVEVSFKEKNIVLNRQKFDSILAERAANAGVKIFLKHKFVKYKDNYSYAIHKGKTRRFKTDLLIGCDGPLSQVARTSRIYGKRKFFYGLQARARLHNENVVEFYPSIGTFAWIVPENNNVVRIGVLARDKAKLVFDSFLKSRLNKGTVIERQAGLVPVFDPAAIIQHNNIFLAGDAALQVKATTGGGIIPGLIAAKCLSRSIAKGEDYKKLVDATVGRELRIHLLMRKILDRFSEEDYNRLIQYCSTPRAKQVLSSIDRDRPAALITSLLLKEPRFLYFIRNLLI